MAVDIPTSDFADEPVRIDIREAYEAIFIGVLGRKPSPYEIVAWLDNQGTMTPAVALAESLRTTDEYGDSLALQSEQTSRRANGKRVFFLHVPKSGGSSIRAQIRACLGGVPPLVFALRPKGHQIEPGETSWPFLTGHISIDFCPPGYSCVTVLREPRARLLSLHRFIGSIHFENFLSATGEDPGVSRQWRESSIRTLLEQYRDANGGFRSNPQSGRRGLQYAWMFAHGASTPEAFSELAPKERKQAIARGLERVSHAAWTDDAPGISRMIETICGRSAGESRRLNITSPTISGAPEVIDAETQELISEFVLEDLEVQQMAASAGLLEGMSRESRDAAFQKTAKRLGYVLQ